MVYGCGNKMIKFLIFITNLCIFGFGLLVFSLSLWASTDPDMISRLSEMMKQAGIDREWLNYVEQVSSVLQTASVVATNHHLFSLKPRYGSTSPSARFLLSSAFWAVAVLLARVWCSSHWYVTLTV